MPGIDERDLLTRILSISGHMEKEMAIHSGTLAWKIPSMQKPDRLQVCGVAKSRTRLSNFTSLSLSGHIGVVNKNIKLVSEICYTDGLELWESHLYL